jgi:hypothetical protein
MTGQELKRARQAYVEYRKAQNEYQDNPKSHAISKWHTRHGDFLMKITKSARDHDPDLNSISVFEIIAEMTKHEAAAHEKT